MPVHHSPPGKNKRSQRHQAVLRPTARAPLDCKLSAHQLSANLYRGPPMEGEAPSRREGVNISQGPRSRKGESEHEKGEDSEETEVAAALAGAAEAYEAPNLAPSNQPLVSQA
ncbi:hypothetical protein O181_004152 [Austropuccinia psidii MF-1]|uniref:Uncharacterized protein n=1 Tax=Austropuccinia psidii MF-1 TaxID=1389203 RepID=A0A9Q3BFP3_9BASI|nr:hypothetical protein [Austropuccinia psidii MF-1]